MQKLVSGINQRRLVSPMLVSPVMRQIMKNSEITRGLVAVWPFDQQFKTLNLTQFKAINLTIAPLFGRNSPLRLIAENSALRDMFRGVVFNYSGTVGVGSPGAEPWVTEVDVSNTEETPAISTAADIAETFNWMSRYRETLSKPDLTDEEKTAFVIWLASFVMLCIFVLEHQYPAVGNEVQRIDATVGNGMFLFAVLSLLLLKKRK